ncbi:helix-turn-helix transcriptional regulator [Kitasatospora sp. NRRL B-11411]|uniref:helix-turn-helix domain-containing protein n=1 Tax=Kitasatospora sp. NRRL B-11411 TaxID=1463822 RepID=UPI0004C3449C|nr:helix-turn-helix transcriptional regulator [Kitasatospora sp. NRRL B-11411]
MTFEPTDLGRSKADLAETLRTLRRQAGLSGDRLALRCGMSQSKISKIETGRATPSLVDVERILRALNAPSSLVAEIVALARIANTEWQDARNLRRKGLDKKQAELAELEKSAREFRFFLLSMITGLLSTPDYVKATLAHIPGDHSRTIARKLDRQAVLYDRSKSFTFVLTEQAVRWPILRPAAMAVQIDHLASLSRLPSVRLGVIPIGGYLPSCPLNTFTVYDSRMATVEVSTGAMVFRDPRDVRSYLDEFTGYERCALFGDEARARLSEWSDMCRGDL